MKCNLIDISVIILFQKKSNFPVTARDLIFYWKNTAFRRSHRRCLRLYQNKTLTQVFFCETCLVFTSSYFEQHLLFCPVWSLGVTAYKCPNIKNKNLKLTFFSLSRNRKISLCKEHFQGSSCNKSVNLGRRWTVKIDLCLTSFLIYNI